MAGWNIWTSTSKGRERIIIGVPGVVAKVVKAVVTRGKG